MPFLAALPSDNPLNVNSLHPEVLAALVPQAPESLRSALLQAVREQPFLSAEDWADWTDALTDDDAQLLTALEMEPRSHWFEVHLEARLDSVALRRSVVLDMDASQGRGAVVLSLPAPE